MRVSVVVDHWGSGSDGSGTLTPTSLRVGRVPGGARVPVVFYNLVNGAGHIHTSFLLSSTR